MIKAKIRNLSNHHQILIINSPYRFLIITPNLNDLVYLFHTFIKFILIFYNSKLIYILHYLHFFQFLNNFHILFEYNQ